MVEKGIYEVVWPRGRRVVEGAAYAPRLDSLENKIIGELWDWVFRGDEILPMLEEELAKRYPGIKFVNYNAFGSIHGGDEAKVIASLPEKLRENKCDAVISCMGC